MIRDVDLVSYLPEFMQLYTEPVEGLKAENPEFIMMWKAVDRLLYNRFISTADEYGIGRFEKMLGIYPQITDALEVRRMRVQSRWFNAIPYTIRVLTERIGKLLEEEQFFSIWSDFKEAYALIVILYLLDDNKSAEIQYMLSTMVPENIVTSIVCESIHSGKIYFGAVMQEADIIEMKQR